MEGIQVKLVDFEEKSIQEKELELLEKHEQETGQQQIIEPETIVVDTTEGNSDQTPGEPTISQPQFGDEDVLSYLKNKFNKEVSSLDDLFKPQDTPQELLPEDVNAFLKFKKETGRGLDDFYRVQKDFTKESPESLIANYLKEINPEFDDEDIQYELSERFSYDEDEDDEKDIKKKKLALKKELAKATKYFEEQKEKYRAPLESRVTESIPSEIQEGYNAYKQYVDQMNAVQQDQVKRAEVFAEKTNNLFSEEFKGFDFKVGEREFNWKPGTADEIKSKQSDLSKFLNTFLDENGYIKDAKEYHKTMAVAMNRDAFARYFYEQGKADAVDDLAKQTKNIDMNSVRSAPDIVDRGGFKVRSIDADHGSSLRIKNIK